MNHKESIVKIENIIKTLLRFMKQKNINLLYIMFMQV